jgi:hypothetical protein
MPKSTYPGHVLKRGDRGAAVRRVQDALNEARKANPEDNATQPVLGLDGDYGPATEKRVTQYQAHHGLQSDGEVGPQTWASLFHEPLPPKPKKTLGEKAFGAAVDLIGTMEVGGNNTGPMVSRIIKGNGGVGPEPWCGDFAAYCYRQAGAMQVQKPNRLWAYVPWMTRTYGVAPTSSPRRGDLVRFDWNGDGVYDHVGLFDRWVSPVEFATVEGNTGKDPFVSDSTSGGDGVHRRHRSVYIKHDFLRVRG